MQGGLEFLDLMNLPMKRPMMLQYVLTTLKGKTPQWHPDSHTLNVYEDIVRTVCLTLLLIRIVPPVCNNYILPLAY